MKQLSKLVSGDRVLLEEDILPLLQPVEEFPPNPVSNQAYLLTRYHPATDDSPRYEAGLVYKYVTSGEKPQWQLVNYKEEKACGPFKNVWATSTRNQNDTITVFIHWDDPEDDADAHWHHTIVVRKHGSKPTSPYDGEIVGYSSVRNQYSEETPFVDTIDATALDDSDIIDGDVGSDVAESEQYFYNLFSVTTFGVVDGTDGAFVPYMTWELFRKLVRANKARYCCNIGDEFQMIHEKLNVTLVWQVVDFNHAVISENTIGHVRVDPSQADGPSYSVTFLLKDCLLRGSFDHKELLYGKSQDDAWDFEHKKYYLKKDDITYTEITTPGPRPPKDTENVYEKNPCPSAPNYGRNYWVDSNARRWLNSDSDDWEHKTQAPTIFDTYSTADADAGFVYVTKDTTTGKTVYVPLAFGFLNGLDPKKPGQGTGYLNFVDVLAFVKVKTLLPQWKDSTQKIEESTDRVFLPSYVELFGDLNGIGKGEGVQFDIYSQKKTNTRLKTVIHTVDNRFDTTYKDPSANNVASWWLRTTATIQSGSTTIHAVRMLNNENRRYDAEHKLDEDGASPRACYISATERDERKNKWKYEGVQYANNIAPAIAPCVVIA